VQGFSNSTLKSLTIPGGILLLGIALLLHLGWLTLALPAVSFLEYCALIGGMLLAWRFHSSRVFFALLVLFLAQQAIALSLGVPPVSGPRASSLFAAVAVLVPLNFVLISIIRERGFTTSGTAPLSIFLFVQSVLVLVVGQSAQGPSPGAHTHHLATAAVSLPNYALLAFAGAATFLLVRAAITRKPTDSALLWTLVASFLSLRFVENPRFSTVYATAAMCVLATSVIETSYLLAYHDELTTLPSRRAFNDALHRLQAPYSIAEVDIDHFKRFNDSYGHETGDEVLRLVAARLARVTGGGQAYRCGGEEFVILFPGKTVADVADHLEQLRVTIAASEFCMRGGDRRQTRRGPDRRGERSRNRPRKGQAIRQLAQPKLPAALSVTVSIGVAGSSEANALPDVVLQAADKALYRAKNNGRNRVETAAPSRRRSERTKAAGIA